MGMALPKQLRNYLAEKNFSLARETKHYIYRHTTGRIVVISKTCSDNHGMKNAVRDINKVLREAGVETSTAGAVGV